MLMWLMAILAGGTMLILALVAGFLLGWANRAFHVEMDPKVEAVLNALPGANCGGCGYVGCSEYAQAVVAGKVAGNKCTVGGVSCATALAKILGIEVQHSWPYRAVVHCGAEYDARLKRSDYLGEPTCSAANVISGLQGCTYGCLGLGDCERSCRFDAIHMVNGLAKVDYDKCVGCGACQRACPRGIISMVPFKAERMTVVACSSKDPGKVVREVCTVGCIGCGICKKLNDLFNVTDGLAQIDYDRYAAESDLSPAAEKCPRKIILHLGKPSEKDLVAVAGEELRQPVQADSKTTADRTPFRG